MKRTCIIEKKIGKIIDNTLRTKTLNKNTYSLFNKIFSSVYSSFLSQIKNPIQKEYWKKQRNIYRNKLRAKIAKKTNNFNNKRLKYPVQLKHITKQYSPKSNAIIKTKEKTKISPTYGFAGSIYKNNKLIRDNE